MHRLWSQRELVHRGAKPATLTKLQRIALNRTRTPEARATAMFTLKLLAGARANATIQRVALEPAMREVALHALVDDKRQLTGVPVALFVTALNDTSLAVRAAALNGLARLGARDQADAIVPLLTSPDTALAHLAVQALVALGARDVALRDAHRAHLGARAAHARALRAPAAARRRDRVGASDRERHRQ